MAYGRTVEHKIRAFHVHAIFDFAKKTSRLFHSQSFRQLHHCHRTYSNCHIPSQSADLPKSNTGEPSVQLVTSTAKNNKNLHYSANLILTGTLQQALQFGFVIAYQVHQNVLPVAAERPKIRGVPAALRHPWRESTQKTQSLRPARRRQHRSHQAMVSIQDG